MNAVASVVLDFVEQRIRSMLERPELWGSNESVELQMLLLLEMRWLALSPLHMEQVKEIQRGYRRFLRAQFPDQPPEPLSRLLERFGRTNEFTRLLGEFVAQEKTRVQALLECIPTVGMLRDRAPRSHLPPRMVESH